MQDDDNSSDDNVMAGQSDDPNKVKRATTTLFHWTPKSEDIFLDAVKRHQVAMKTDVSTEKKYQNIVDELSKLPEFQQANLNVNKLQMKWKRLKKMIFSADDGTNNDLSQANRSSFSGFKLDNEGVRFVCNFLFVVVNFCAGSVF
jgi:hypothetical protein